MLNSIHGVRGAAVAPHALAAQSAAAILREGGNALEAMIAAAATIAVVYPHMNGIGGDSFWLLSLNHGETVLGVEGCGAAAGGVEAADYRSEAAIPYRGGRAALTVAGTISAWDRCATISRTRLGGRMTLERLLADAIDYARHGAPVSSSQYRNTLAKMDELAPVPGFATTFLDRGHAPRTGSRFVQARLARVFERLAHAGLDDFYRGDLARSMAADLQATGSPLTLRDLEAHRALERAPLALAHSAGTLYNMPPPTQGLVSLLILGMLDRLEIRRYDALSAEFVHGAVEAAKRAFLIRDRYITDPRHMAAVDAQDFLNADALSRLAADIDDRRALPWPRAMDPADTVWLGTMDRYGNAVSMIQSVYHEFGSGVVLEESGVTWQNRGASFSLDPASVNRLVPGKKPFHTLNPALAILNDGRTMAYGSMGGEGQPQSQSAVFSRVVDFGLGAQAAVSAPRWLLGRTWGHPSTTLKLESRFPSATVQRLSALGHAVEIIDAYDEACGHAGCLVRDANGFFEGGADPRSDGGVAVC